MVYSLHIEMVFVFNPISLKSYCNYSCDKLRVISLPNKNKTVTNYLKVDFILPDGLYQKLQSIYRNHSAF